MRLTILTTAVLLAASVAGLARGNSLPEGIAATAHGAVITMDEFKDSLVRRFGSSPDGQKALKKLIDEIVVSEEARARGVAVTPAEIDAYVKKVEVQIHQQSRGTDTLSKFLEKSEISIGEFKNETRAYLLQQKLAAKDIGVKGEVSRAQLEMWLTNLRKKKGVLIAPVGFPDGGYAEIGARRIGKDEFGEALLDTVTASTLQSALWDLVVARIVQQRMKENKVRIDPADVKRAIDDLKAEFEADPRFRGTRISFESYVQGVRNMSLEQLKKDSMFLAQVGLAKSIRNELSADDAKGYYEENRKRYDERRRFIHLLIAANERKNAFGSPIRSYADAKKILEALHLRYLRGTSFEKLVEQNSQDRSKYQRPERIVEVHRGSQMPASLLDAIFLAPKGEVIGPVRSAYGYHLVKVVEIIPAPTYEQAYPQVVRDMVRKRRTKILLEIKQDSSILLRY